MPDTLVNKPDNNCTMDSSRSVDVNGWLTAKDVVITSATVHQYKGSSIPNWKVLGLDGNKIYWVYRPLDEIIKSKDTFIGVPLLADHIEIDSKSEDVTKIGTVAGTPIIKGNDLISDLKFWNQEDINKLEGVDANGNPRYTPKKGISAGYRYTPVLESGVFEGKPYNIRMTNLIANHVAHVDKPRNEKSIIHDSLTFDKEDSKMARKMGKDEGEEGSLKDEILDILQADGDIEEKAKKIRVLISKSKSASDEKEDGEERDDKMVKDKKGRAKDEKDCAKAEDEDDDKDDKKMGKDRKMGKDDISYTGKNEKDDKYEYVAKDSIDEYITAHNRNYREALNLCSKYINNAMALDTAEDLYNTVISNRGASPKAFNTLDAKREFVKAINNITITSSQRVPSLAMDSVSSNNKLVDMARADIDNWYK